MKKLLRLFLGMIALLSLQACCFERRDRGPLPGEDYYYYTGGRWGTSNDLESFRRDCRSSRDGGDSSCRGRHR